MIQLELGAAPLGPRQLVRRLAAIPGARAVLPVARTEATDPERAAYRALLARALADQRAACAADARGVPCQGFGRLVDAVRSGRVPVQRMRDVGTKTSWAKFYDPRTDAVAIRPFTEETFAAGAATAPEVVARAAMLAPAPLSSWYNPVDWAKDAWEWTKDRIDDLGDVIVAGASEAWDAVVAGAEWAWERLKEVFALLVAACKKLGQLLADPLKRLAAIAAAQLVCTLGGVPTTGDKALEVAEKICLVIILADMLAHGVPPPIDLSDPVSTTDARDSARFLNIAREAIATLTVVEEAPPHAPARPPAPSYPVQSFAVYDPGIQQYRIFAPQRSPR